MHIVSIFLKEKMLTSMTHKDTMHGAVNKSEDMVNNKEEKIDEVAESMKLIDAE